MTRVIIEKLTNVTFENEKLSDGHGVDWGSEESPGYVVLKTNDDVLFKVYRPAAAKMSTLLQEMLEDQEHGNEIVVPIPEINGVTLGHILVYWEHYWDVDITQLEKPLRGKLTDVISEWDKGYLYTDLIKDGDEKEHSLLIDVINGANFLHSQSLLDLTCAAVASMIKGKTPEEIRSVFNIENDFSPEEEEKIREENRWCEES